MTEYGINVIQPGQPGHRNEKFIKWCQTRESAYKKKHYYVVTSLTYM